MDDEKDDYNGNDDDQDNEKPSEQDIDLDMSGEDDNEGKKEDLGVVDRVVDVRPVRGAAKYQEEVKTGKRFLVFLFIHDSSKTT